MGKIKDTWIEDVEELLQQSVVEDAVARSLEKFEVAISSLDEQSHDLITRYFSGITIQQLSRDQDLTVDEVTSWINRLKRELVQKVREQFQVKQ